MINEINTYKKEVENLKKKLEEYERFVPPGHFYSPIPDFKQIKSKEEELFKEPSKFIEGIDLNEYRQIELLKEFSRFYSEQPFSKNKVEDSRYYFENEMYSYGDGIILYSMLRKLKPKRIIEIGSGYTSALMLDVNEMFFGNSIKFTFIDPYCERLKSLIRKNDSSNIELIEKEVQEVIIDKFKDLESGDILFIDSSHVSKINSDVNYEIFKILPNLKKGVYIHFHDIFYPFEYPKEWIYEGRAWNESYFIRCFLQYNYSFRIEYFTHYMSLYNKDMLKEFLPLTLKNHGASLWIKKVGSSKKNCCIK